MPVYDITRNRIQQDLKRNTNTSRNLTLHFVTVFSFFQFISLSTICWCFPSKDQSVEPNTNATDPNLIAVILKNPFSNKRFGAGDVQSRHLKWLYSWLQSLSSTASQAASDVLNNGATGAGSPLNLLLGGQSSYAYPFPFRR